MEFFYCRHSSHLCVYLNISAFGFSLSFDIAVLLNEFFRTAGANKAESLQRGFI